jgi:hypothetical protein
MARETGLAPLGQRFGLRYHDASLAFIRHSNLVASPPYRGSKRHLQLAWVTVELGAHRLDRSAGDSERRPFPSGMSDANGLVDRIQEKDA